MGTCRTKKGMGTCNCLRSGSKYYLCQFPLAPAEKPRMLPTAIHEQNTAFATLCWSGPRIKQTR